MALHSPSSIANVFGTRQAARRAAYFIAEAQIDIQTELEALPEETQTSTHTQQ